MFENITKNFRAAASRANGMFPPLPQNIQSQMKQIDYTRYAPMGRVTNAAKYLSPKLIQQGVRAFENDAAQLKAMRHFDSAQATANRIKSYAAQKAKEEFARVHQRAPSIEQMLRSYSNYFRK